MPWEVAHDGAIVIGKNPLKLRLWSNDTRWSVHAQTEFAGTSGGTKLAEGVCGNFADGQTKATRAAMEIVEALTSVLQGT